MDFGFSEEQDELRTSVRRFLTVRSTEADVRRTMASDSGYDIGVWEQMADQLGLQALAIPECFGGAGFDFTELGLVLQEMGRALLCAPFLSGVLASQALLQSADQQACRTWLPQLAAGTLLATLVVAPARQQDESVQLSGTGENVTVTGRASFVLDGHLADLILLPVTTGDTTSLVLVSGSADGLRRQLLDTFDQTRKMADLTFTGTPASFVGTPGGAGPALSRTMDLAAIALSLESLGVAERALDMAVDYAKLREQFGRPIGSFQAIKHKLANVLLEVEAARSAAWYALWAASHDPAELPVIASLTAATCSEAAYLATAENIQVHGGMGYTWEHPAHLYFRRATTSRLLLGDPDQHRDALLKRLGYDEPDRAGTD